MIDGKSLGEALNVAKSLVHISQPLLQDIVHGRWKSKSRNQISSSSFVVHTLEAVLWSIHQTNSFEDALNLAVNLANEAETVGAVTGQIAGAM